MRTCQNCGKVIVSTSRGAKWCSSACKTNAYRKRHGIAAPDFLTTKRKAFLSPDEEREIQRLQLEIKNYEAVLRLLEEDYSKWHKAQLLFEAYGASDRNYDLDGTSRAVGRKEILSILGVREPPRYWEVKDKVTEGSKGITKLEEKLLIRQRKVFKIIDGAKTREVITKKKNQSGVVTGRDLAKMQFDVLPFDGQWKELIGDPARGFYGLVWGDAKAGKSYFSLSLASYLTQFGKVAYIATEEGFSETMKKKVVDVKAYAVQIIDTRELAEIAKGIADVDFVFIDSATKIDLTPQDLTLFKEAYPTTAFIVLLQSVKDGVNFKGDQRWKHDCDFVIEVERPSENKTKATCAGRFASGSIEYGY